MTAELYASDKLVAYRYATDAPPAQHWLWPLFGAGIDNLGQDGRPILVDRLAPAPDQLLVRHDAVGLCFSDTKIIKAGDTHPRLNGRDMATEPVVMGHEVALTVIEVGENLVGQYAAGDRFIIQADIYFQGVGLAYGYALQGGLSQYNVVGREVLDGDGGCYLIPMAEDTGYAQAALTEPWACVTASYEVIYRAGWQPGGSVLIVGGPAALDNYQLGSPYAGGQPPASITAVNAPPCLLGDLEMRTEMDAFRLNSAASLDALAGQSFDDIVILGGDAATYEACQALAAKGCVLNLVGGQGYESPAHVDVGRLHYDHLYLVGTTESDLSTAYAPARTQLVSGGKALFVGAAGPMGQMHVQRALQSDDGPSLIVGTNLRPERMAVVAAKLADLIESKAFTTRTILRTPRDSEKATFNNRLFEETGGSGYDDIVIMAPSAKVVAGASAILAENGVMNVFAGLPRGTMAEIDLRLVTDKGARFTGTSGSAIEDLRLMLNAAETGQLDPNMSVVAIAGLNAAKEGIEGLMHQAFPGKCVIYPQLLDLPLTYLSDLHDTLPGVAAKLGPNNAWTNAAEAQLLGELLP